MNPVISVLTPTWNRASYLHQVWDGLQAQGFRNFKWIVANDGSQDETVEVVRALAQKSDFPVTLISASQRVGKSRIDNEAVIGVVVLVDDGSTDRSVEVLCTRSNPCASVWLDNTQGNMR